LFLSHGAKQVDNQIKSIKSSDALAKEGIFVINPLWHAHRRATGTREKVGGIRLEWMNNHLVQRHYKFIHLLILLKNPHFLFLIDAKNAFDSNMKVARDKFSSTLVLTRENKLLLALKRGSESAFSSERRAD
jgi:hypothetical protein